MTFDWLWQASWTAVSWDILQANRQAIQDRPTFMAGNKTIEVFFAIQCNFFLIICFKLVMSGLESLNCCLWKTIFRRFDSCNKHTFGNNFTWYDLYEHVKEPSRNKVMCKALLVPSCLCVFLQCEIRNYMQDVSCHVVKHASWSITRLAAPWTLVAFVCSLQINWSFKSRFIYWSNCHLAV